MAKQKTPKKTPKPANDVNPTEQAPNAPWFKPVMFSLMLLGLVWIIVFYLANGKLDIPLPIGSWNILVGFGIAMAGFLMSTRWR